MGSFVKLHVDLKDGFEPTTFKYDSIEDAFNAFKQGKLYPIEDVDILDVEIYFTLLNNGKKLDGLLGSYKDVECLDLETFAKWLYL